MWRPQSAWRRPRIAVEIAEHPRHAPSEGLIERMRQRGAHIDVVLLLADGRPAATRVERLQAEWLELRIGDIVPVRPVADGCVSG
jgi:hypothetical protein